MPGKFVSGHYTKAQGTMLSKAYIRIFGSSSFGNERVIHYSYTTNNKPRPELQMTNKVETTAKNKHLKKMVRVYKGGIKHAGW